MQTSHSKVPKLHGAVFVLFFFSSPQKTEVVMAGLIGLRLQDIGHFFDNISIACTVF